MKSNLIHPSGILTLSHFCRSAFGNTVFTLMALGAFASPTLGATAAYVSLPIPTNSSSTIPTGTTYTSNLGYAFKTGSSGTFDIDWVNLELINSTTFGPGTFTIAIHGATNDTPYSPVASSTAYATDTVSFPLPGTANTSWVLQLTTTDIPNITSYSLLPNTAYSLIVNSASSGLALRRATGIANGTTNDAYAVTNGFTMLDTFRNNTPNYTNAANSYPAFAISFGTTLAIPEPSALALFSIFAGGSILRRRRTSR